MGTRYALWTSAILIATLLTAPSSTADFNGQEVTLTGQVLSPEGKPVADCRVLALCERAPSGLSETVTDAEGQFEVKVSTPKELVFEPKYKVIAIKDGYALGWSAAEPEEPVRVTLGVNPVTCTGTVTDRTGRPIAGAKVYLGHMYVQEEPQVRSYVVFATSGALTCITDETGRFQFSGLPADATMLLLVSAEGKVTLQRPPAIPADSKDIQFILQPAARISGRITCDGQPVPDVRIIAQGASSFADTQSNANGTYIFKSQRPGTYNVMVDPPEGYTAIAVKDIKLEAGQHFTGADLELIRGGLVEGTVTDAGTGQPVAGAYVAAHGPARPGLSGYSQTAQTDEAGHYSLRLPPGKNTLRPALYYTPDLPYGRADPEHRWVEVVEGETVSGVDFALRLRLKLRGIVFGPDGQPAPNIIVSVAPQGLTSYRREVGEPYATVFVPQTQTRDDGRFEVVPSGMEPPLSEERSLALFAQDVARGLAGIAFIEDLTQPVEITLAPGAYVVSEVTDAEQHLLADIPVGVEVKHEGERQWAPYHTILGARSDEQGHLRVGPLPTGQPLRLLPGADLDDWVAETTWQDLDPYILQPGQEYELPPLRINLQGRAIRGWVGDQQQNPIEGAKVLVTKCEDIVESDADGYFALTGLPMRDKVWIVATHPTQPLCAATELDPDWGFRANLILRPLGSASGQVCDAQGHPVASIQVSLFCSGQIRGHSVENWLPPGSLRATVTTDAEGNWTFESLIANMEYNVLVEDEEHHTYGNAAFTAQAGQTVQVETITLK